jgi:hypothetical protein
MFIMGGDDPAAGGHLFGRPFNPAVPISKSSTSAVNLARIVAPVDLVQTQWIAKIAEG